MEFCSGVLIRKEVENFLVKFGVFKVGIADLKRGFKMAFEGCHPRDVMRNCNSVIVFALHVGLDYYTTLEYSIFIVTGFVYSLQTFLWIEIMKPLCPSALKIQKIKLQDYPSS
jgi:hypothetical protein